VRLDGEADRRLALSFAFFFFPFFAWWVWLVLTSVLLVTRRRAARAVVAQPAV
jgi:hypothetical protein